ncbi:MAG: aldehyde dehydrogenase family protein [Acidobacteriota bacterium]
MAEGDADLRSIQQARHLAERANQAARTLASFPQESLDTILESMQNAALPHAEEWARMAVEETGFGNVADKTLKNRFSIIDLYRHIRPMRTVGLQDPESRRDVLEIAAPVGVVAGVIPSTNPTSTAIYKIFIALKAGNAIVLSPHPHAQRCVHAVAETLRRAAAGGGAPPEAIACLSDPTLEGTHELMRHPSVAVILATGGAGLVQAAYSSGKPAYGVGPGNVPAFVDRTADVAKAARDIITGKTFDNGVLCSSENAVVADLPVALKLREEMTANGARFLSDEETAKLSDIITGKTFDHGVLCSSENAVIADAPISERLEKEMRAGGAYFLAPDEIGRLSALAVREDGSLNTGIVGKSAEHIAALGELDVPSDTRCLVARLTGVGKRYPLSREKLSPILAYYVEDGWEACCARVFDVLHYGGMGHTMSIHSRDRDLIMKFAMTKPVFRICVNTPAAVGAVGLTTALEPSMTLGCGALGGNITSDNIMPRHLVNLKRLAFETRSFQEAAEKGRKREDTRAGAACSITGVASVGGDRDPAPKVPAGRTDRLELRARVAAAIRRRRPASPDRPAPSRPSPSQPAVFPAHFVSEADIRQALVEKRPIVIDDRTIITPSARDLGRQHDVFQKL